MRNIVFLAGALATGIAVAPPAQAQGSQSCQGLVVASNYQSRRDFETGNMRYTVDLYAVARAQVRGEFTLSNVRNDGTIQQTITMRTGDRRTATLGYGRIEHSPAALQAATTLTCMGMY